MLYEVITEEMGITSKNVDEMLKSSNPEIKRFLGVDTDFGQYIGLSADWAYRIIKHVGNYGEIYERNVGPVITSYSIHYTKLYETTLTPILFCTASLIIS